MPISQEIIDKILMRLEEGEPLRVICRDRANGFPDKTTYYEHMETDKELQGRFARARKIGHDAIAWRLRETARGRGESTGDVQRDKLIIDTDLKLLAKWSPKEYGDKISAELSGPDGGPVQVQRVVYEVVDAADRTKS